MDESLDKNCHFGDVFVFSLLFFFVAGNSRIPNFTARKPIETPSPNGVGYVDTCRAPPSVTQIPRIQLEWNVGFTGCSCKENIIHSEEVNLETLKGKQHEKTTWPGKQDKTPNIPWTPFQKAIPKPMFVRLESLSSGAF